MVEQRTHKPLVGSSNLPFGTILKTLTSREHGRFFCAGINSEGIFEGSNVTEAAQRAPASVILRCAADGRSARHLRAVALRLPFGTILKTLTSREHGRFLCRHQFGGHIRTGSHLRWSGPLRDRFCRPLKRPRNKCDRSRPKGTRFSHPTLRCGRPLRPPSPCCRTASALWHHFENINLS